MSKKTPNLAEIALVKTWSERKSLMSLRANAIEGNIDWVKLLLHETGYKTYPSMLNRTWWVRDASDAEKHQRTKTAVSVMRRLFDTVATKDLPSDIAQQMPTSNVDKTQALLRLWPRDKYKL